MFSATRTSNLNNSQFLRTKLEDYFKLEISPYKIVEGINPAVITEHCQVLLDILAGSTEAGSYVWELGNEPVYPRNLC